jgi:hypothetical protein
VKIEVEFFWVVTPCEDEGSTDLWNVGILPQHYTASQPRRTRLESLRCLRNSLSLTEFESATEPCPEPEESNPHPQSCFSKTPSNVCLPSDHFPSGFPTEICINFSSHMGAICQPISTSDIWSL